MPRLTSSAWLGPLSTATITLTPLPMRAIDGAAQWTVHFDGAEVRGRVYVSIARGDLAAMIEIAADDESFADGLLEYPHYTRPAEYPGRDRRKQRTP